MDVEVTKLRNGRYVAKPKGQIGTVGTCPFPWTMVAASTPEAAEAAFRDKYHDLIAAYDRSVG